MKIVDSWLKKISLVFLVTLISVGCAGADDASEPERPVDANGKRTFDSTGAEELAPGKDDSVGGRRGLPVSVDDARTQVWKVDNAWSDTDTAAAREAGMAWGENSGLTWDEKYQRWVDSLEKIETEGGFVTRQTFMLTTPWGKTLPSPRLECAEAAIFLRIAFASWYNLPFYLEAADAEGRIFFGHFGMRRRDGRFGRMPNFKTRYPDFSDRADAVRNGEEWPSDPELRDKKIPGSFDDQQPMIGPDAHAGAYFDEVFLNKRVGHFMILTLAWFGSVNLADAANTFNVKADAVSPGDVLVERWQRVGIGHTLIVMRSQQAGETVIDGETIPQLEVELTSGSMPRRQPVWESSGASKRYFSLEATGGPEDVEFGGGLKRWRTARNVGGRWTNVVPSDYANVWINSTNHDEISARLERFEQILVELSPEQKRDVLLDIIESKRQHLREFPASCAARIGREDAFDSLYELMADEFDTTRDEVDAQFRTLEDYVFAELEYEQSKTCCWNRSTNAMYEIVMDFNVERQQNADACMAPVVFMNRDDDEDGYALFRAHAEDLGRGDEWVDWSADESCPQHQVAEDTIAASDVVSYCALPSDGGGTDGDDGTDGGDTGTSESVTAEFDGNVSIPDNDSEGVRLSSTVDSDGTIASATVSVDITHTWSGDLEIELVHPDGTTVTLKESDWSSDDDVHETYQVTELAGKAAGGTYELVVRDTASIDTGTVDAASVELRLQ